MAYLWRLYQRKLYLNGGYIKKKFINAKIYGYEDAREILVEDGSFKEFGNKLEACDEVIDLDGRLVIPPYVDSHLHLDYYMIGKTDEVKNES